MFDKVLIANRGAIACRIIRTLRTVGVKAVAVYAKADAGSRHVAEADEAYCLGEGSAADTYLHQEKLFRIARESGAQAVHPGYGFLSENADFARLCAAEGLVFLGPTPAQMEAFGLKHTARALAEQSGVPLLPGTGLLDSVVQAVESAEAIGYPVMLKSTAGGGGIGMQLCHDATELTTAFESVRRLSANNFSNSGVFLEKYVTEARHIEVQIFGDGRGRALALGERDCSTQRRNQKVIEETPAPGLPVAVREQLQHAAVALTESVDYCSAGTVEFIYDARNEACYFLEVNTRLQVEHGVTEEVFGIDLVRWMIELGAGELAPIEQLAAGLQPRGHAIQVRAYAEDPGKQFQPCAGMLSRVEFPTGIDGLRIDTWVESGVEVAPLFDPMLAKIIAWGPDRDSALARLDQALAATTLYGIETNIAYARAILHTDAFRQGRMHTRFLNGFDHALPRIDVLAAGTMTTIQDYPGRQGHWDVGVPPSGPFDDWSFRLGNRLLGNAVDAAGLEITLTGPSLRFRQPTQIVLTGADCQAALNGKPVANWSVIAVDAGATLTLGKIADAAARTYLLVRGGFDCPAYLASRSTFTLGQFGGHAGRALRAGDVLAFHPTPAVTVRELDTALRPALARDWTVHVIYGPHGAPDFFTQHDIDAFFAADWEVHYNSSRTGIRLIGPKPEWARTDGGEAGMHPSNIHDNAYALGAIDFTGDMPVILGPDGPSLGGFVSPATVVRAERWKLGQLRAGDRVRFVPITVADAVALEAEQLAQLDELAASATPVIPTVERGEPIVARLSTAENGIEVVYRRAGDHFLLVEYGPQVLDIALRFRVHALMLALEAHRPDGVKELTPGIRSLQVHYDSQRISLASLLAWLKQAESQLGDCADLEVPARVVHIPLSWDDDACRQAVERYVQSVRKDAPWCPSNIEFIRRINGLESIEAVKRIVFDASYVVMGLGDVYLGAPVATPLDPRHRLVTTKYNPARTWTAENSVGIGGSYLCIYGMEGPGGYQFIGRTLQMWNRYRTTREFTKPWLLRFFDQIRFYEVSADELLRIRDEFPRGNYPLRIEETRFSLRDHQRSLADNQTDIARFTAHREAAFADELQRWRDSGQLHFDSSGNESDIGPAEADLTGDQIAVESQVAGSIWQWRVEEGSQVEAGQVIAVLESMKMEIEVHSSHAGVVAQLCKKEGSQIGAGQRLLVLEPA